MNSHAIVEARLVGLRMLLSLGIPDDPLPAPFRQLEEPGHGRKLQWNCCMNPDHRGPPHWLHYDMDRALADLVFLYQ